MVLEQAQRRHGVLLGAVRARLDGEPEHLAWAHRSASGGTPVPPVLQKQMIELRDTKFPPHLQAKYARLPFENAPRSA